MVRCQRTLAHGLLPSPSLDAFGKERLSSPGRDGTGRSQGIGGSERSASGGSSVVISALCTFRSPPPKFAPLRRVVDVEVTNCLGER